ncbi:T9SS type A sorting domain-containing protein [Flavobacterium sp. I3-2]|uniref:T9SS type A sorting domain-containing protein n=1 Tax=Flavobacterium sp. I3-2 TaxID=2748319 RepID=UPI0015B36FBB|nr:T9SS type A sorting domain-containing protein [Flavobacterium sp. I3-2]
MKKIYTLFFVAITSVSFAQTTVTKQFNEFGFANEEDDLSGDIDENINFVTLQNAASLPAKYFTNGNSIRLYPGESDGNSIEFYFSEGIIVSEIIITGNANYTPDAGYFLSGSTTPTSITAVGNTYTISGIAATESFTFQNTINATSGNQIRIAGITITYTEETASIKDNNIEGLKVYPNPASELVYITSNEIGTKNVAIYDMLGKKVLETSTEETVNVSTLTSGVYIMKISQDGKNASRKLVIK